MKKLFLSFTLSFMAVLTLAQEVNEYYKPLKYRSIGPFRGGRSVTASGVLNDPLTYYMGTTGGGLWKTDDAGQRWTNISDGFFKTGSVGAVTVSESDPNIVYCGMGEHAVRGVMTSYGDGVYKSTDAGKTWKHIGLKNTQHISRIVIHPKNPDIVLVAAQGALYGPTKERGIYKSIDGGKTWKNVLFVNDLSGGVELSMDMNFPDILYAAMWHHQRKPWIVISGGEGSGLYKSTDGGETWKMIHEGLPKEKGKMAIAVSRANSNKVFALIESDTNKDLGGLFVSTDRGEKWNRVSGDNRLTQRAWYYTEVFTDPSNEEVVYVLSAPAMRSIDGGKSWETLSGTHGDYHDLWIHPENSKNMVIANDGGAAISFNYGKSWSRQDNMPTAQIYRINADRLFPYNIYGGQQDNSSLKIASLSLGRRSIDTKDWSASAGGESAFLAFDPDDPRYVLGGSYLGTIQVLDTKLMASTKIMAAPIQYLGKAARDMRYLYNWNAPIIRSSHHENTYYHAAQFVLRTKDMGLNWEEISPDLTRNLDEKQGKGGGPYTNEAVGAENYGTISYLVESPYEKGILWSGSDDGLVHISKDDGQTWENVSPKGLGECLINAIDVSPHENGTAYIATTRYKFNDFSPGIYKTTNYGKSWKSINKGIPVGAYTRVVREDKTQKNLLYAGTETGIYISWDGGTNWESFQLNLPVTPINDLMVHQGDLVVATSGRSFWILDDLGLLSQERAKSKTTKLYTPENTVWGSWGSPLSGTNKDFDGTNAFEGVNPANGMVIYYHLPELDESTQIQLNIKNEKGVLIQSISSEKDKKYKRYAGGPPPDPLLSKNEGLNRFVWNMRHSIMPGIPTAYLEAGFRGHAVSPGSYHLELVVADAVYKSIGTIVAQPNLDISKEQFETYDVFMSGMEKNLTEMHETVNVLKTAQDQIKKISKDFGKGIDERLVNETKQLVADMIVWDGEMVQRKSKAYDDVENFENKFTAEYIFLINQTDSSIPRVNQSSRDRRKELEDQWASLKSRAEEFLNVRIPELNKKLWTAGIGAIRVSDN